MPEHVPQPRPEETPTATLVRELLLESERLLREEIRFVRLGAADAAKRSLPAAALVAVAGALGIVGFLVLCLDVVYVLAYVMPLWVSALVIGGALCGAAGLLAIGAQRELKKAVSTSRETVETVAQDVRETAESVKEDVRWEREKTHAGASRTPASA